MTECAHCGADVAAGGRYCPQCGRAVDAGDTRVLPIPPEETGPVPVHRLQAERRLYGVTPATLVLGLACVALTGAVVLFVLGRWPVALVALGIALLLLAVFAETARRHPPGRVTRASAEALDQFRARANVAADSLATRGRALTRLLALRRELRRMAALRTQLLFELGEAVYRGDDEGSETARGRVEELDRLVASTEAQVSDVLTSAQRRIDRRRLEVQPTEMVERSEEPGEITPPEPAVIPEQYPPPDEATPPQPAVIPEPGPAVIPEPSPQPQTPEGPS